jgi:hypothetical protein
MILLSMIFSFFTNAQTALEVAKQSAELVSVHDRSEWLKLYDGAQVQDPVGTVIHKNGEKRFNLDNFYDVFIAPNQIVFESHLDIDNNSMAVRDVTIKTLTSKGTELNVDAFVFYEVNTNNGQLLEMRAYWELNRMIVLAFTSEKGLATLFSMMGKLIKEEGLAGVFKLMKGLDSDVKEKKKWLNDLVTGSVDFEKFIPAQTTFYQYNQSGQFRVKGFSFLEGDKVIKSIVAGGQLIARIQNQSTGSEKIIRVHFAPRKGTLGYKHLRASQIDIFEFF